MSLVGVFFSLTAATLINVAQVVIKPQQKHKKWYLLAGLGNLAGSVFLGMYGMYHMYNLYEKVPEL